MTDIVERLRKGIEWTGPTQDDTGQTENYMDEAADQITALRAEVSNLKGVTRHHKEQAETLRAEVERLKDANAQLQEIVNGDTEEEERIRAEVERLKEWNREIALNAREFAAENEKLRAYALKAFTVVEFCSGEGFLLEKPHYDCDDLLMEGVELLKVETSEQARAALEGKP